MARDHVTRSIWVIPLLLLGVQQAAGMELANFHIFQNDFGNGVNSVTLSIPSGQSTPGVSVYTGPSPTQSAGDYFMLWGTTEPVNNLPDDVANGVMLPFVTQNYSRILDKAGIPLYGIPTASAHKALYTTNIEGVDYIHEQYVISTASSNSGIEVNINVSGVYFPFEEGWITGVANNSANGGAFTSINSGILSPTGTNIVTLNATPTSTTGNLFGGTNGQHQLFLPTSLNADTRTDGLLFVAHAKNEDNYALSYPSATGDSFHLMTHDNGTNSGATEQDPIAFTYLPFGQTDAIGNLIAMGKVNGDGDFVTVDKGVSTVELVQGGAEISTTIPGLYTLTIPGMTPSMGVLMVSPEADASATAENRDNFVTYQPNATGGWDIAVRDIGGRQPQLQSVGGLPSFSFAFIPFENAPTGPVYGSLTGHIGQMTTNVPEPTSLAILTIPFGLVLWSRCRRV